MTSVIALQLLLLQDAKRTIDLLMAHLDRRSDMRAALANVETVLLHWIDVLEKPDEPHHVQRRD